MGRPKKPLEGKEKEAAFVYALLRAIPSTLFSLSLPDVLRSKGFTDQQSNNPGLQKRVQRGAGCKETHAAVIKAVLAAAARITEHTIPETDSTDSNDEGSPSTNKRKSSATKTNTVNNKKKFRYTPHQVLLDRSAKMKEKEIIGRALSVATIRYAEEKAKQNGLSAQKIADLVNQEYKVSLHARTITR